MAKPLVVSISHELGRDEAKRRLSEGLDFVHARFGNKIQVLQNHWDGDVLTFEVAALGQRASGTVEVAADRATLVIRLPLLLAMLAEKARSLIQREGQVLLEKK